MKKFIVTVLSLCIVFSCITSSAAAIVDPGENISPCWAYMSSIDMDMYFNGTEGDAYVSISRIGGVTTRIEATMTVYIWIGNDWEYLDSISDSTETSLSLEIIFDAIQGKTYKMEVEVTAYSGTDSESDTVDKIRSYR